MKPERINGLNAVVARAKSGAGKLMTALKLIAKAAWEAAVDKARSMLFRR